MLMDTNFLIAQIFGVLALVASVCSMQFKKRRQIFAALLLLNLFAALNLVFLNSLASAYISFFAIFEMLVNGFFERKKKPVPKPVVAFYAIGIVALGALNYTGPLDLIPIACALIFCATILTKKEQNIRKLTLVNQLLWLIFDLAVGAYTLSVSNVLTIISDLIALRRYRKQNKKRKTNQKSSRTKKSRQKVK